MTSPADPVAIARDLLRCPSVTPVEGGALSLLERTLKGAGFTVHRMTFSEPGTADVENLYARIGTSAPHLMFAGHTDVVPPGDPKSWSHAPFSADIADGVLYGRGAVDMKGAIACKVAAALDHGSHKFDPSNLEFTSIDIGNATVNLIPGEARARFNIRFNDCHNYASLKALVEQRAKKAAGDKVRWTIDWEPSNADVFYTEP